ncbi:hypothetical protein [Chitinolyticbacter albus]|uniref:hypothetical protein n=1 Tax=Chitinolyticbacter albus TaxID=2961951 RepID=UPI00210D6C17|nr:hypothetical protein [Chitinolyticbacter albus]
MSERTHSGFRYPAGILLFATTLVLLLGHGLPGWLLTLLIVVITCSAALALSAAVRQRRPARSRAVTEAEALGLDAAEAVVDDD